MLISKKSISRRDVELKRNAEEKKPCPNASFFVAEKTNERVDESTLTDNFEQRDKLERGNKFERTAKECRCKKLVKVFTQQLKRSGKFKKLQLTYRAEELCKSQSAKSENNSNTVTNCSWKSD